jgi:hypothetical protein
MAPVPSQGHGGPIIAKPTRDAIRKRARQLRGKGHGRTPAETNELLDALADLLTKEE